MRPPREKREGISSATITQTLLAILACSLLAMMAAYAADPTSWNDPSWWSSNGTGSIPAVMNEQVVTNGGVVSTNYISDQSIIVVQGQLKQFTVRAVDEMNANLPGGAGTNLNTMASNWAQDYATNNYTSSSNSYAPYNPRDYTTMNVGQLKQIGSLVWSPLVSAGYTNALPSWLATTNATDYNLAVVGQLKMVFNFDLSDSDGNGLPDWWERKYFGQISLDPNSHPDGNGYTLLQDYYYGLDPTNYYSQLDGSGHATIITPAVAVFSGNNQISTEGSYTDAPLVVKVTNSSGGAVLPNAPVDFSVASGGGQLVVGFGSTLGSAASSRSNSSGLATVYFQQPSTNGVASTVTASSGGQSVTFTETTSTGDGTLDAPSDGTMTRVSDTEIDLTWVNHATAATYIVVQDSTDNGTTWTTIQTLSDHTATSYQATGLTAGVVYLFRVAAGN